MSRITSSHSTFIAFATTLFFMILLAVTAQSYRSATSHVDYATIAPVTAAINQATTDPEASIATPRVNLMRP